MSRTAFFGCFFVSFTCSLGDSILAPAVNSDISASVYATLHIWIHGFNVLPRCFQSSQSHAFKTFLMCCPFILLSYITKCPTSLLLLYTRNAPVISLYWYSNARASFLCNVCGGMSPHSICASRAKIVPLGSCISCAFSFCSSSFVSLLRAGATNAFMFAITSGSLLAGSCVTFSTLYSASSHAGNSFWTFAGRASKRRAISVRCCLLSAV